MLYHVMSNELILLGLKLHRDVDDLVEPIPDNPPDDSQAAIDSWFCERHAPALPRVLSYIEGNVADLYQDEGAFAAFVHYALSTTIKKSSWRLGRNKKLVSHLFTKYDEALALLILENNCTGIQDIANGVPVDKKKIKTKYTCEGKLKQSDGGCGWTKEAMRRVTEFTGIVEASRENGRRVGLEMKIKVAYLVTRARAEEDEDDEEDDEEEGGRHWGRVRHEPVYVCTGIPI